VFKTGFETVELVRPAEPRDEQETVGRLRRADGTVWNTPGTRVPFTVAANGQVLANNLIEISPGVSIAGLVVRLQ
jgi:hypothetical protein